MFPLFAAQTDASSLGSGLRRPFNAGSSFTKTVACRRVGMDPTSCCRSKWIDQSISDDFILHPAFEFHQDEQFEHMVTRTTPIQPRGSQITPQFENEERSPLGFQAGRMWEAARAGLKVNLLICFPPRVPYGSTQLPSKRTKEENEDEVDRAAKRIKIYRKRKGESLPQHLKTYLEHKIRHR